MSDKNLGIWLLLLAIFVGCTFWHIRENNSLARQWKKNLNASSAAWFTRFAWSRSLQFLFVLLCTVIVTITYDWKLNEVRNQLALRAEAKAIEASPVTPVAEALEPPEPAPIPVPSPVTPPAESPPAVYYPPSGAALPLIVASSPESSAGVLIPPPQASALPPVTNTSPPVEQPLADIVESSGTGIESVYSPQLPESEEQGAQEQMNLIKQRYEGILVTHFFLKKCNRVNPVDYHVILSALGQEIASANAPGRLQYDILTAAQGSYQEMYAQSSCEDATMESLKTQYQAFIDTLANQYATPQ